MSRSGSAKAGAAARYDAMFKRLFNKSRMAGDLLQAIAPDRFLAAVDLGTLCQAGGNSPTPGSEAAAPTGSGG